MDTETAYITETRNAPGGNGRDMSKVFRQRYHDGDEEAIFEYARRDIYAFREAWVIDEIESHQGQKDGAKWLRKLMSAYAGGR